MISLKAVVEAVVKDVDELKNMKVQDHCARPLERFCHHCECMTERRLYLLTCALEDDWRCSQVGCKEVVSETQQMDAATALRHELEAVELQQSEKELQAKISQNEAALVALQREVLYRVPAVLHVIL